MKLYLILFGLIPKASSSDEMIDLRGCQPRSNNHLKTIAIINDDFFTTNPDNIVIKDLGLYGDPETDILLSSESYQNRVQILPRTQSLILNNEIDLKNLHTIEATIYCSNKKFVCIH